MISLGSLGLRESMPAWQIWLAGWQAVLGDQEIIESQKLLSKEQRSHPWEVRCWMVCNRNNNRRPCI